ncbi:MAG: PfkB family carbohydrate kinase [Methylophilus sp.]
MANTTQNSSNSRADDKVIALFGEVLADVFPDKSVLGGAPFNVARHLKAFRQHPIMISRTGHDALRKEFIEELTRLRMDVSGIQTDPVLPTGQVKVIVNEHQHVFDIEANQAYDHIHAETTHHLMTSIHPEMVYFGTLAQRNLESRLALDTFLSDAKCPRFLDLNLRNPWYDLHTIKQSLLRADIVKLNDEELTIVADYFHPNLKTLKERATLLLDQFDFHTLLITCGHTGAWAMDHQGLVIHVEGNPIHDTLMDTVGAGDGFSAVCILGLLHHWSMDTMLNRANQFAASICQIRGAVPKDLDLYSAVMHDWNT